MKDEIAIPLDPIYVIGQKGRTPIPNKVPKWNRWRASLPDHCWDCVNFDKCEPTRKCRWNPKQKSDSR